MYISTWKNVQHHPTRGTQLYIQSAPDRQHLYEHAPFVCDSLTDMHTLHIVHYIK